MIFIISIMVYNRSTEVSSSFMSQSDNIIVEICDFLETWTLLIITITLNSITSYLFFKRKLKKPISVARNRSK